ncbi:hypothetical protein DPMN_080056 [Dreissena polymorpha]|uniref:Uncharacterized protein n=1 Tax=Dreissena polymorpha TaxID=45954 RepID=A0A9D3YUB3_DREPO|nr:hypothetical protein DPMN_080056 [Dreissena polymorpha]
MINVGIDGKLLTLIRSMYDEVKLQFHENRSIDVAFRVKNAPPPKPISKPCTMSLGRSYLLTKFHEDLIINVASRLLARQNAPTPGNHFFNQHFFDSLEINVASRVLTSYITKNAPAHCGHVFQAIGTIFELVQDIIRTNVLTKFHKDWTINVTFKVVRKAQTLSIFLHIQDIFHEDWTINVTFRVLTSFHYRYMENAPWWQYTIETNLQTKFHEDPTMNQASTMLTKQLFMSHNSRQTLEKIIKTNVLNKCYEDWTINVTLKSHRARCPMAAMFCQSTATIFELVQDIIGTNLVTKFHEDRTINVGSRVLTRQNAPFPGCHIFQPTGTIFEFFQDIIGTNLNKIHDYSRKHFHENRTINLASREDQEGLNAQIHIQNIIKTNILTKFREDWTIQVT